MRDAQKILYPCRWSPAAYYFNNSRFLGAKLTPVIKRLAVKYAGR